MSDQTRRGGGKGGSRYHFLRTNYNNFFHVYSVLAAEWATCMNTTGMYCKLMVKINIFFLTKSICSQFFPRLSCNPFESLTLHQESTVHTKHSKTCWKNYYNPLIYQCSSLLCPSLVYNMQFSRPHKYFNMRYIFTVRS